MARPLTSSRPAMPDHSTQRVLIVFPTTPSRTAATAAAAARLANCFATDAASVTSPIIRVTGSRWSTTDGVSRPRPSCAAMA
jgi:hypothetical protein